MNEQLIGDLFAEATRRMTGSSSKEFSQKFAELIVKECVTICQYNADDDDDQFDLGRVHQAKEITHLITTHFGVEE